MSKITLLDRKKNFYKANLHCHTTCSDGKMTPEQIKEIYKAKGYSIVAFTDHEHLLDQSHLNDDQFLAITSCEVAIKEFPHLSTLVKTDMKVCHLNFYSKDPHNVDTPCYSSVYDHFINDEIKDRIVHSCGEYEREYGADGISAMIKEANKKGFLVSYNHPRWSLENATDYLGYEGIWAVEIYNSECNLTGIYEYDINVYDDFLRADNRLACTACDDNHGADSMFGGFIMVNAEKLDYYAVIDALEKHNFYASTGPVIKELYVEDGKAYLSFEGGEYALMSTKGRRASRKLAQNPNGENTVCFDIKMETDEYIRFDVVGSDGKRANTCAYFIDELCALS